MEWKKWQKRVNVLIHNVEWKKKDSGMEKIKQSNKYYDVEGKHGVIVNVWQVKKAYY